MGSETPVSGNAPELEVTGQAGIYFVQLQNSAGFSPTVRVVKQ
jgi:hypothetical protein